jgi:hypothetical protein
MPCRFCDGCCLTPFARNEYRAPYRYATLVDLPEADHNDEVAVWTMNVKAKGTTAEGSQFSGIFHNARVFVRTDGRWQLLAWANAKTGELEG